METEILKAEIQAQGIMTFDTNRASDCARVVELIKEHAPFKDAKTYGRDNSIGTLNKKKRWSQTCDLNQITNEEAQKEIDGILYSIMSSTEKIFADRYKVQVDAFDYIELLKYEEGGHYIPHFDQCTGDRKASLLIYLNDDYEGGHTAFPETYGPHGLGIKIQPKAGRVLIFDCSYTFIHAACPIIKGTNQLPNPPIIIGITIKKIIIKA